MSSIRYSLKSADLGLSSREEKVCEKLRLSVLESGQERTLLSSSQVGKSMLRRSSREQMLKLKAAEIDGWSGRSIFLLLKMELAMK